MQIVTTKQKHWQQNKNIENKKKKHWQQNKKKVWQNDKPVYWSNIDWIYKKGHKDFIEIGFWIKLVDQLELQNQWSSHWRNFLNSYKEEQKLA